MDFSPSFPARGSVQSYVDALRSRQSFCNPYALSFQFSSTFLTDPAVKDGLCVSVMWRYFWQSLNASVKVAWVYRFKYFVFEADS